MRVSVREGFLEEDKAEHRNRVSQAKEKTVKSSEQERESPQLVSLKS